MGLMVAAKSTVLIVNGLLYTLVQRPLLLTYVVGEDIYSKQGNNPSHQVSYSQRIVKKHWQKRDETYLKNQLQGEVMLGLLHSGDYKVELYCVMILSV